MKEILRDLIENLKNNVPGFIAVSITDISSGESLDSFTTDENFDPNLASAFNLEVVKAKLKAIKALNLNEEIQDITITLSSQFHIINVAPSGAYFIYLAVSSSADLSMTKSLLNNYKAELINAL
ncbi:hypothetical protein P8625_03035 [Tenacibaculum tangerinum]|uniref:Roadblock/LAMTOR2 domain-containing protein n=1 Tax=Tenacibaculum tangerinum TaxID=3038772 RepID=A0ABY8L6A2_9FLAO|nr:hypothetical protein [Tenacibaculum tangerinum]WGH76157.1 hypothetical protein P8625_03035 [Tenacibaculum tangerinum]